MIRALKGFKLCLALLAFAVAAVVATGSLAGCGRTQRALQPPAKYVPGENFDRNGQSCGTRCWTEPDLQPCR